VTALQQDVLELLLLLLLLLLPFGLHRCRSGF